MDLKGIKPVSHIDFTVQICDIFYNSAPIFYNTALFTGMDKLKTRHLTGHFIQKFVGEGWHLKVAYPLKNRLGIMYNL